MRLFINYISLILIFYYLQCSAYPKPLGKRGYHCPQTGRSQTKIAIPEWARENAGFWLSYRCCHDSEWLLYTANMEGDAERLKKPATLKRWAFLQDHYKSDQTTFSKRNRKIILFGNLPITDLNSYHYRVSPELAAIIVSYHMVYQHWFTFQEGF